MRYFSAEKKRGGEGTCYENAGEYSIFFWGGRGWSYVTLPNQVGALRHFD